MIDTSKLIFIHGLMGSSQGVKATLLRAQFPGMTIPDFRGGLAERMAALSTLLGEEKAWTIVGSSFGGLMGALYACQQPEQVNKLVLFAPALVWPEFADQLPEPVDIPTIIYHGSSDKIVPLEPVRQIAEGVFLELDFRVVNDDHGLYKTVHALNWQALLS